MVKRYFKLAALILLYLLIFIMSQGIVGVVFGIAYLLQHLLQHQAFPPSGFTDYLNQNIFWILIISYVLAFLAYWLIYKIRKMKITAIFRSNRIKSKNILVLLLGGVGLSFLTMSFFYLTSINKFFPSYDKFIEILIGGKNFWSILFTVGIFGPICEEVFFRGVIFNELKNKMPLILAVIIQAGLFGLIHGNLLQGSYAFILGLILGWVYLRFKSIFASMLVHMAYNSTSVLASKTITDQLMQANIMIFALSSFVITVLFVIYLWKTANKNEQFTMES